LKKIKHKKKSTTIVLDPLYYVWVTLKVDFVLLFWKRPSCGDNP